MMRLLACAMLGICAALPASAWTFTPGTPCVLTHTEETFELRLTYDPALPLYSIAVTQNSGFASSPTFAMRFDGPMPIQIATDRHILSADRATITVTDSGFGNVLNGLQYNQVAAIILNDRLLRINLQGAADPVAAFRACDVLPAV